MTKPQQQELARSGRAATDPSSRSKREAMIAETLPPGEGGVDRTPEENRPGHRPERDQDKPEVVGGAGRPRGRRKR